MDPIAFLLGAVFVSAGVILGSWLTHAARAHRSPLPTRRDLPAWMGGGPEEPEDDKPERTHQAKL